jgi:hypothetical protein
MGALGGEMRSGQDKTGQDRIRQDRTGILDLKKTNCMRNIFFV